jgi:hypothetical protein
MFQSLLAVLIVLMFYSIGLGQVDTLQLCELVRIQTPDWISFVYVEEMTGDNIKDFVVCTGTHLYIYNGANFEICWISPYILCAGEIKFADADGDNDLEIFCRSGQNIYVFNPPNQTVYWTSPAFGDLYRFFAVGDRNNDGYADIVMLFEEPFGRPNVQNNYDTVWINVYDGPTFLNINYTLFRLANYSVYNAMMQGQHEHSETVTDIFVEGLEGDTSGATIGIFYQQTDFQWANHNIIFDAYQNGILKIIHGNNLNLQNTAVAGATSYFRPIRINGGLYIFSISDYKTWVLSMDMCTRSVFANLFNHTGRVFADTLLNSITYHGDWPWKGVTLGDIAIQRSGGEFAYIYDNCLSVEGVPDTTPVWRITQLGDNDSVLCVMRLPLYSNPQVVVYNDITSYHYLYDGSTGRKRAVIAIPDYPVAPFSDYNNDDNYEICTLRENTLMIYNLQRVSVDEGQQTPEVFGLSQNYPNPFNARTIIGYSLPEQSSVCIDIYDLLGRKVETLNQGIQPAGQYRAIWDGSRFSSGMYLYRLTAGNESFVKRAILIK